MEITWLASVPMRFHGCDFDRLMLQRVKSVLIAEEQLQRSQDCGKSDCHPEHRPPLFEVAACNDIACANREHDETGEDTRH